MAKQDIRWQQRFSNYRKALAKLSQAVDLLSVQTKRDESVDELLQEGLIQRFEYTHELAWKVMKWCSVHSSLLPLASIPIFPRTNGSRNGGRFLFGASEAKHQVLFRRFVIVCIFRHAVIQVTMAQVEALRVRSSIMLVARSRVYVS